jgi:hypothetical protein
MESTRQDQADRIKKSIERVVADATKNGAKIQHKYGTVAAIAGAYADVYLDGDIEYASEEFRIPAHSAIHVGSPVRVAIPTDGNKYIEEVLPTTMYPKIAIDQEDGVIYTGDGTVAPATPLSTGSHTHTAADDLLADDIDADSVDARSFAARAPLATDPVFWIWHAADDANLYNRWDLDASGTQRWGPSATTYDLRVKRTATKTLTFDDAAGGAATINIVGTLQEDGVQVSVVGHTHTTDFGEVGDITTQAFGDAPVAGATGEVADAGHKHGMPANPVITTGCALYTETAQSVASNAGSIIIMNFASGDVVYDSGGMFTDGSDSITIPVGQGGTYDVKGHVSFQGGSTVGVRRGAIRVNGANAIYFPNINPNTTHETGLTTSAVMTLAAGDIVTLYATQSSGGALNTLAKALSAMRIR